MFAVANSGNLPAGLTMYIVAGFNPNIDLEQMS